MSVETKKKITRDDLERELRGVQDRVIGTVESKRTSIMTGVAIGLVVFALVCFLLGKRSGKRKSTIVEVRRI